jgi:hypothetical protein
MNKLTGRCSLAARGVFALGVALAAVASGGAGRAATVVGAGNTAGDGVDEASIMDLIDQTDTVVLGPGTYTVTTFSTQYDNSASGTLIPFLVSDNGSGGFAFLAVGASVADLSDTGSFQSYAFGGDDSFTLNAPTQVDVGFYFLNTGTLGSYAPIDYDDGAGQAFQYYAYSFVQGGLAATPTPSVGGAPSGYWSAYVSRTYDFSETIWAVPEPSAWTLLIVGLGAVGAGLRSRRRTTSATA